MHKSDSLMPLSVRSVFLDRDGTVIEDKSYLGDPAGVQLLPGAPDSVIDAIEENIRAMGQVTDVLRTGTADDLLARVLKGAEIDVLSHTPVEYRCTCSRERVSAAVATETRGSWPNASSR